MKKKPNWLQKIIDFIFPKEDQNHGYYRLEEKSSGAENSEPVKVSYREVPPAKERPVTTYVVDVLPFPEKKKKSSGANKPKKKKKSNNVKPFRK
jgi:hypothetical protein